MKSIIMSVVLATTVLTSITGCSGGGGSGGGSDSPSTVTGTFIDDPVQGLNYACSSGTSGTTDSNGEYTCNVGDDVIFSVGNVEIGTIAAQSEAITPYILFPNNIEAAINLARLLQVMDTNEVNGTITLSSNIAALVPSDINFTSASYETTIETAIQRSLVDATEAVQRMNNAIENDGGTIPEGGHIPVANAGADKNVNTTATVQLNGSSSSDADHDSLTYEWTIESQPETSTATLSGITTATPNFTADVDGLYVFSLIVNDGILNSASDTVAVIAITPNIIPIANAGIDQNILTTATVVLDGNNSYDDNNETITYSWSITSYPNGSNASLTGSTTVSPTFVADLAGDYTVQLIVNDGHDDSIADTVTITATTDTVPVARAGADQNVYDTEDVTLDGSASSDDGSIVSYEWKEGSTLLSSSDIFVKSDFSVGTHTVTLTVEDDIGQTHTDTVDIVVSINVAPVANAGVDTSVEVTKSISLNGSASSDANSDALTYLWNIESMFLADVFSQR